MQLVWLLVFILSETDLLIFLVQTPPILPLNITTFLQIESLVLFIANTYHDYKTESSLQILCTRMLEIPLDSDFLLEDGSKILNPYQLEFTKK